VRGKVLPVGGIKENSCGEENQHQRNILCHENKSDIDEIKSDYLDGTTFHYVKK
jgi:ATP-dependent Lon protease